MTDDKVSSEGMSKSTEDLFTEWWLKNSEVGHTHSGIGFHAFTSGFNAGRKAEREITARLLMYARHRDSCGDMDAHNHDKFPSCNCGLDELKDAIRGGNDAK